MNVALPDVRALKLLRSRVKTAETGKPAPGGVASPGPLARGPLGPGPLALGPLGTKLPVLVGLACARIDELRAVFARARTPGESGPGESGPGESGPGESAPGERDAGVTKRMVLRVDRLIRWIDKVRALVPGADITPDIAARLEVAFAAVIELVCGRIEELGEALSGRREGMDVGRVALDADRMVRWAARLKKLVARAKPGGPELPPDIVARLDAALATVVRLVCTGIDALTVAFDEDHEPEVIDGVMSQLDRMLRWVERMKKLAERTKPTAPAASAGAASPEATKDRARSPIAQAEAGGATSRATSRATRARPRGKADGKPLTEAPHPAAGAPDLAAEAVTGPPMPAGAGASR